MFDVKHPNKNKERVEIYDFKNRESQMLFKVESSKTNTLTNCLKNPSMNFQQQVSNWKEGFDSQIKKCFKKIRLSGKIKESDLSKLITERTKLKKAIREATEEDTEEIEKLLNATEIEITKRVEEENFKIISENFKTMTNVTRTFNSNGFEWTLKKANYD